MPGFIDKNASKSGPLCGMAGAAVVDVSFVHQWVAIILFVLLGIIAHLGSINQDSEVKQ
jgi:hypothetical protein